MKTKLLAIILLLSICIFGCKKPELSFLFNNEAKIKKQLEVICLDGYEYYMNHRGVLIVKLRMNKLGYIELCPCENNNKQNYE